MASLGALVAAIAKVEGLAPDHVGRVARYLREGELINMKGRGGSAAQMTVADATNLLIGVNASRVGTSAAELVPSYRKLEAREPRTKYDPRPEPPTIATFGPAIEELVQAHVLGEFPTQFAGSPVDAENQYLFENGELRFQIIFNRALLGASIRVTPQSNEDLGHDLETYLEEIISPAIFVKFLPRSRTYLKNYKSVDRREQTIITGRTLRAVAECLRS